MYPYLTQCYSISQEMAQSTAAVTPATEPEEDPLKKYEDFLEKQVHEAPQKFVVHLSSDFDVDGENAGSRIISWVDKGFHTLEERRTELNTILFFIFLCSNNAFNLDMFSVKTKPPQNKSCTTPFKKTSISSNIAKPSKRRTKPEPTTL